MIKIKNAFLSWLPLAAGIVGVCALVYGTVQQNYRQSLNDPQIEMAEDGASTLEHGGVPADIVPRGQMIDASTSLAPFIMVFDKEGNLLESSATIGNTAPKPPKGIFDDARANRGKDTNIKNENRVTWQPDNNTRIALVVKAVDDSKGYFVAAGRNMREVENRESKLSWQVLVGLIFTLGTTLVIQIFVKWVE